MNWFNKIFWPLAFALHLMVLLCLYFKSGINFSNESEKYISIAKNLTFDNFSTSLQYLWSYSTYILFLTICFKLGFSVYAILFIQYCFCLSGFYFFYKFILKQNLFPEICARISLLLIVTCPIIIYWLLTFYTESFFLSLVMITTYLVFNAKTKRNFIAAAIFAFLLLFCRPVGVFYVIGLVFVTIKLRGFKYSFVFLLSALVLVFTVVLFFLPLHYNDFALPIFQGSVICGFPSYPYNLLPEGNYALAQVYSDFLHANDFSALLSLSFKKAISFFTLTRPYYSLDHNIINSLYYFFLLGGFYLVFNGFKRKEKNLFVSYFISVLTPSLLIVILVYNEWSERFMVPLLPFFIVLTSVLISRSGKNFLH